MFQIKVTDLNYVVCKVSRKSWRKTIETENSVQSNLLLAIYFLLILYRFESLNGTREENIAHPSTKRTLYEQKVKSYGATNSRLSLKKIVPLFWRKIKNWIIDSII